MPTLNQLSLKGRKKKRRRNLVAALKGGPQRRGVVMKMRVTNPRKPNSAKRRYARVRVMASKKIISAHPPGVGLPFIQEYSIVLVEGGSPPDTPGVNYSLIRGKYDFCTVENYGRSRRRSKFGAITPINRTRPYMTFSNKKKKKELPRIVPVKLGLEYLNKVQIKALKALNAYKDRMRNLYIKKNDIKGLINFELKKNFRLENMHKKEKQRLRGNVGFLPKLVNFLKYRFKEEKQKQMWKVEKIMREKEEEKKKRVMFRKYIGNMISFYREREKKRKFKEWKRRLNEKKKKYKKK